MFGRHLVFRGEAGMQGRGKLAWSGEEGGRLERWASVRASKAQKLQDIGGAGGNQWFWKLSGEWVNYEA